MTTIIVTLLSLVAVLAPLLSARPDEPLWSSFLGAAAMAASLLAVASAWGGSIKQGMPTPLRRARGAAVALAVWVLLSIIAHIVRRHGSTAFLAPMLRGGSVAATDLALFFTAWYLSARHRDGRYIVMLALIGGAAIAAAISVQEYAIHVRDGESAWRVFGTSTPDYLAAYMAMTLPLTVALLFSAPAENRLPVLVGLVAVLQLATLLTTGSRFALVSLFLSFCVFGFFAYRRKRLAVGVDRASAQASGKIGTIAGAVAALLVIAIVAKPVARRLMHNDANSGAFRVWTWKGSLHMALANPIFGSGVGTYVYEYPKYALTGFTRLAHSGYLQIADECGFPALLLLLTVLFCVIAAVITVLIRPAAPSGDDAPSKLVSYLQRGDDRLLLAGLLAGLVAGMAQNLIDSDWSVFFIGSTFWLIAGLTAGIAQREIGTAGAAVPEKRLSLALAGVCAAVMAVFTVTNGVSAFYADQAKTLLAGGGDAEASYAAAQSWSPWDGRNLSDLAYKVYLLRQRNTSAGETGLKNAITLEPSYVNFHRLGNLYKATGRTSEAIAAYERGLREDPNSLDLILDLAAISPPDAALEYYRRIQTLERGPVGQVRALGDITEERFATANAAVADDALRRGDAPGAAAEYERAAATLEKYADEGGQGNPQRSALLGGISDPARELETAEQYRHVTDALSRIEPGKSKYIDPPRRLYYDARFDSLIAAAYQSSGDAANALRNYDAAAKRIETAASGGSYSLDADRSVAKLYGDLLDHIASLSPPDSLAAVDARRAKFTAIVASVFHQP